MKLKHQIYEGAPVWFQNLICDAVGLTTWWARYGSGWGEVWSSVIAASELSNEELATLRARKLEAQFAIAATSPYWKRIFSEVGLRQGSSSPFEELAKLPVLTKATARENSASMITTAGATENTLTVRTSGSTGSPLHFLATRKSHQEQWAIWWRYRGWHGLSREKWYASFGGKMIVPRSATVPPFWRRVTPDRRWFFSSYHLSRSTAQAYISALKELDLTWLHGYPSAISTLAALASPVELEGLRVQMVTTGAETLTLPQRKLIEERFSCPVRQHYGLAEGVANISECPEGRLHVDEDFAHVEFIPIVGQAGAYSIIGTNLSNPAFPLFRYDTGDQATIIPGDSCTCGRAGRIVRSIDGRTDDSVVLRDGTRVGRLSRVFAPLSEIIEAQIVQEQIGEVTVRIVKGDRYDELNMEERLREELDRRLGHECSVRIAYVDSVPRTSSGKVRLVVSAIPMNT